MSQPPQDDPPTLFKRPWESDDPDAPTTPSSPPSTGDEDVVGPETSAEDSDGSSDELGPGDLVELTEGETSLDHFSHDDYMAATTREYQGLAEEVAQADTEEFERQAVAAALPGVGSGLIGFDDVTGRRSVSEEEIEHEEQQRASDLTLRIGSAIVLLGLFLGSLFLGSVWFAVFVTIIMLVALGEFYATVRTRGYAPIALFGLLGLIGSSVGVYIAGPIAYAGFVALTIVLVGFFYSMVSRRNPLENATVTVFGMAWVATLSFAAAIGGSDNAVALILLVVLVTAVFDVGSYFVGRTVGRRLIAPVVSPKKTVEGLIGGVVFAFGLSALLSTFIETVDLRGSLVFATMVCVLAPLGDAAESVVKRALDVKDMGSILPGHGGILDRVDALLFVVPASYFLFDLLEYL